MNTSPEIGYQSCRFNGLFLEQEIAVCRKDGIKIFDIFFDAFKASDIDGDARKRIKDEAAKSGVKLLVHAPLVPLAGPHISAFRDSADFAAEIGAPLVTVHIGHFATSSDPASELKRCARQGIKVALENAAEGTNWNRPDSLGRLVQRCKGASNVGMTLDIGHANLVGRASEVIPKFIAECVALGVPILCVHAHDNVYCSQECLDSFNEEELLFMDEDERDDF